MAFGGVAMGIIKAQLAAKTNGKVSLSISISLFIAKRLRIGRRRNVVAVLLVNSVKSDVITEIIMIVDKRPRLLKLSVSLAISSARPDEIIIEAIASPPPKSIKTFHGIFLYQSKFKIGEKFLFGIIKKRNDPKIAITGSERSSSYFSFKYLLKIQRIRVILKINIVIFSLSLNLPSFSYFDFLKNAE